MNKKLLSSVMAITVVGTSFMGTFTNVSAEETPVDTECNIVIDEVEYKMSSDTLDEDVVVKVPVKVTGNSGIGGFTVRHDVENGASFVDTDNNKFEVSGSDIIPDNALFASHSPRDNNYYLQYENQDGGEFTEDGIMYEISVKIPAGSKVGDEFPVTFVDCDDNFFSNGKGIEFTPSLSNGAILLVGSSQPTTTTTPTPTTTTTPAPTTTTTPAPTTTTTPAPTTTTPPNIHGTTSQTTTTTPTPTTTTTPAPTTATTTTPTPTTTTPPNIHGTTSQTTTTSSSTSVGAEPTSPVDDTPKVELSFRKDKDGAKEYYELGLKENEEFYVVIKIKNVPESYNSLALQLKYDTSCAEWIDEKNGWTISNEGDNILNLTKANSNDKDFTVKFKALKSGTINATGQIDVSGTVLGVSGGTLKSDTIKYEVTTATTTTVSSTSQSKPGNSTTKSGSNGGGGGTTTVKNSTSQPTGDSGVISYLMALVAAMGVAVTTKKNRE